MLSLKFLFFLLIDSSSILEKEEAMSCTDLMGVKHQHAYPKHQHGGLTNDGEQIYPTIFDRRHNVNLLGTVNFGAQREWEFSARWNLGSGFPLWANLLSLAG